MMMSDRIINVEEGDGFRTGELLRSEDRALADEVLTPEALSKFPDLVGLSDREMLVMMAVAHGMSYRKINSATKIPLGTISNIVNRIDPCGRYRLDDDGMKAFIAKRARAKVAETLSVIDIEKVGECSPVQQAKMAKTLSEVAAIQEKKDIGSLGGKGIKKVTVEFVDEIDEAKPVAEVVEERDY
jgi:transposase